MMLVAYKPEKVVCRNLEEWNAACAAGLKDGRRSIPWWVWRPIFERQNYTCRHCGSRGFLSVDHIVPLYLGGGNESSNLQGLCDYCNARKGHRSIG